MSVRIARLAITYCLNLTTLSLTSDSLYQVMPFSINEKLTLSGLQNLSLHLNFDISTFSTLSRAVHNLESLSITVEYDMYSTYNFTLHGLQKLIQSQHQLKTIIVIGIVTRMSSLFKLLESQSNSLESIVLEDIFLHPNDLNIEPLQFHQLTSICVKKGFISRGGLEFIIEADLPKLQQLKFEKSCLTVSDWTLLQDKYLNQVVDSGNFFW